MSVEEADTNVLADIRTALGRVIPLVIFREHCAENNAYGFTDLLTGRLTIVVHPEMRERLLDAMQKAGQPFELEVEPAAVTE